MPEKRILPIAPSSIPEDSKQRSLWEEYKKKNQKPGLVADLARKGLSTIKGASEGFLGVEPRNVNDPNFDPYDTGTNALLQSGLPFSAYQAMKKMPFNKVFHGTGRVFESFNPREYDQNDVLGWMTHFAENPEYASGYATGAEKHGFMSSKSNVIAAIPEAKNILDLVDPNMDDLSQALAAMHPDKRSAYTEQFKSTRKTLRDWPEVAQHLLPSKHYGGEDIPISEIPARKLAEEMSLNPEETKRMPFDAIRYRDTKHKSLAVNPNVPIKSAVSGAPLTEPESISQITMRPMSAHEPKGNLPVHWKEVNKDIYDVRDTSNKIFGMDNPDELPEWIVTNEIGDYFGGGHTYPAVYETLEPGEKILSKEDYLNKFKTKIAKFTKATELPSHWKEVDPILEPYMESSGKMKVGSQSKWQPSVLPEVIDKEIKNKTLDLVSLPELIIINDKGDYLGGTKYYEDLRPIVKGEKIVSNTTFLNMLSKSYKEAENQKLMKSIQSGTTKFKVKGPEGQNSGVFQIHNQQHINDLIELHEKGWKFTPLK